MIGLVLTALTTSAAAATPEAKWPTAWSATLIKLPGSSDSLPLTFCKFYYDYSVFGARFDFYDHYPNVDNQWNISCQIYMDKTRQYFVDPVSKRCSIASDGLGTILPGFVETGIYKETALLRGIPAHRFTIPIPDDPIDYWVRAADGVPMRTTNQQEDPGATDYLDVLLGPQDPAVLEVPEYCKSNPIPIAEGGVVCPADPEAVL